RGAHRRAGPQLAARGPQRPAFLLAIDPPELDPELDPERVAVRVLLEVLDDRVPGGPAPVAARDPVPRQGRGEPRRVEDQAVIARSPARGDLRGALDDERRDVAALEHRRGCEPSRAGAGDHHSLLVGGARISDARLEIFYPGR